MIAAGWSGVLSLPRQVYLEDDILHMRPIKELQQLRLDANHKKIDTVQNILLFEQQQPQLEILISMPWDDKQRIELKIHNKDHQWWLIRIEGVEFEVRTSGKTITGIITDEGEVGPELTLHLVIDHSMFEVFVNYQHCITSRVYGLPTVIQASVLASSSAEIQWYKLGNITLEHDDPHLVD